MREGRVGVVARARCDRLLEVQQEAECEAKQGAAAEAARLAATEAAAAAWVEAGALERVTDNGGKSGSSRASGPSEAAEVPDDYVCPIIAEIMTDPVCTADGFTYERTAISDWLRINDTSPNTGDTLDSKVLYPNISLCSMIRSFAEA